MKQIVITVLDTMFNHLPEEEAIDHDWLYYFVTGNGGTIPDYEVGGVETIRPYVDEFIEFAKEHPELTFLVTRIGCGIAGFTDDEISPLFKKAHDVGNIVLPPNW